MPIIYTKFLSTKIIWEGDCPHHLPSLKYATDWYPTRDVSTGSCENVFPFTHVLGRSCAGGILVTRVVRRTSDPRGWGARERRAVETGLAGPRRPNRERGRERHRAIVASRFLADGESRYIFSARPTTVPACPYRAHRRIRDNFSVGGGGNTKHSHRHNIRWFERWTVDFFFFFIRLRF